jgi:hypothetical protein
VRRQLRLGVMTVAATASTNLVNNSLVDINETLRTSYEVRDNYYG